MPRVIAAIVLALLAAGCGGAEPGNDAFPTTSTAVTPEAEAAVNCDAIAFDPATYDDAPPTSELPSGPLEAVDDMGAPAIDPAIDWKVVQQTDTFVGLLRELEVPHDNGGGDIRTHQSMTLEQIFGATNVPDGTWMLSSSGTCTPHRTLDDGLGSASITLAVGPDADSVLVELDVIERACASGRGADGRIELVQIEETDDQIGLWVAVQPFPGDQDCPGNPVTPFTVELTDVVGDREIVDISTVPPQPIRLSNPGE